HDPLLTIPTCLGQFSSSEVLVETYEGGVPLRSFLHNGPTVFDACIAEKGLRAVIQMVLKDNFVHADMHSGNVLVRFVKPVKSLWSSAPCFLALDQVRETRLLSPTTPASEWRAMLAQLDAEGYVPNIVLLDCGLTNSLQQHNLATVRDCFRAGLDFDGALLANLFIERSKYPERVRNRDELVEKMVAMLESVSVDQRGQILLSRLFALDIVRNFTSLIRSHNITLEGDFSGLFVAGLISESIGRTLNCDLDILPALGDNLVYEE
ncbi:hypothetical protein HDU91_000425, partial [Kappamyces sp. JEL0680]